MTDNTRTYPNVNFVETSTKAVENELIQSYEMFTGRKLYPADPARLFILWIADVIVSERVNIDFSAKQNLPRYAEGEYLDSIAELFKDAYRLQPKKAKTTLKFVLSTSIDNATMIPQGTRVAVDGEIFFATVEKITIAAGETTGVVSAECLTAGVIGNGFVAGQISKLVDIFPYFEDVQNTTESAGGADVETDAAFYERMRESPETYSTAGTIGGYTYFAKTASALIADVKVTSPTPGKVDIRILLHGGELPEEEMLGIVSDVVSSDDVRALTDEVVVAAPEVVTYDIDLTYYAQDGGPLSEETVVQNVNAAVLKYKEWQSGKLGRDIDPSELVYLVKQAGVKRVVVSSPTFAIVTENKVAQLGTSEVTNGGAESE